jgi:hypothetical protein
MTRRAGEAVEAAENSISYMRESGAYIEARWPFFDELVDAAGNMRMRMYRSGSNTIVRFGEEYLQSVFTWNECLSSGGVGERWEKVCESRVNLNQAIAHALAGGPYDTFEIEKELASHRTVADMQCLN